MPAKSSPHGAPDRGSEELPYRVELWDESDASRVERVLARAVSAPLAHAIFTAAQTEHPQRRITLSEGSRIVADTAAG